MAAITNYICSQIDLPLCKYISDTICKTSSRPEYILSTKVYNPPLLALLSMNITLTFKMVGHVKELCSSVGRTEMKFFYYLYVLSNLIHLLLVSFKDKIETVYFIMTVLQLVLTNMCIFSLLVGVFTQDMFIGKWGLRSNSILYLFTIAYGFISTIGIFFGLLYEEPVSIFVMSFILNFTIIYTYFIVQIKKLNNIKAEIWAYGTMLIAFIFFMLGVTTMFVGSELVAHLSEKYLDNLFFHNLFMFCAIVMVHKFWLSVCDYEVECLLLEI